MPKGSRFTKDLLSADGGKKVPRNVASAASVTNVPIIIETRDFHGRATVIKLIELISRFVARPHDDSLRAGQFAPAPFSVYRAIIGDRH